MDVETAAQTISEANSTYSRRISKRFLPTQTLKYEKQRNEFQLRKRENILRQHC